MSAAYEVELDSDLGIHMLVWFTTRATEVTDYAVVLMAKREGRMETIRVYDGAHGHNEMHRFSSLKGKHSGVVFHSGTLGEGKRAATDEIESGYRQMIEGWERQ
jgi:hypothetical protein